MPGARVAHVTSSGQAMPCATFEQALAGQRESGGYVWIDLEDPARADLDALAGPFGLHPLAIEDCLDGDEVPKIEDFPQNTFVIFNRFHFSDHELAVEEVDFFLGTSFLITVAAHPLDSGARQRLDDAIRAKQANVGKGPDHLLHVILDHVVDDQLLAIEALQDDLDQAEELALARGSSGFDPTQLLRLRRNLLASRKSLFHGREILIKICRKDSPFISEAAVYQFRDVYDHLVKFLEVIEMCREMVATLMELHLSLVNNELARLGNRTNQIVRRLTLITTVFMPLSFFAGVGGMSEWSMMTGPENWKIAYPLFLLGMSVVGVASYYLFKWLERRPARRVRGRS